MAKRLLVETLLAKVEEIYCRKREPALVALEAPTGYGKSYAAPEVFQVLRDCHYAERFIHVLPLRAIVKDVVDKLVERIERGDLKIEEVAYQMGERLLDVKKAPLYDATYVVSSLDSFLYNLYKIPVAEIFHPRKHYAIPRLRIFLSGVYFDEAHMALATEERDLASAAEVFVETAPLAKIPLVVASATLGSKTRSKLEKTGYVVRLGRGGTKGRVEEVLDSDFVNEALSVKWITKTVQEDQVVKIAKEHSARVFVAIDDVRKVVEIYRQLDGDAVLIHGLLTHGHRLRALERLKSCRCHLVATSAVEAGVDVSLDVLITDARSAKSVVQRAGRICRKNNCGVAYVYIIKERASNYVLKYAEKSINWRLPIDYNGAKGYEELIDVEESQLGDERNKAKFSAILRTLFVASSTLDRILKEHRYALFRTLIITAYVGDVSPENAVTLDVDRAESIPPNCIERRIAVRKDDHVEIDCKDVHSCVDRATARGGAPAYVIKPECYDEEAGLKIWR